MIVLPQTHNSAGFRTNDELAYDLDLDLSLDLDLDWPGLGLHGLAWAMKSGWPRTHNLMGLLLMAEAPGS